MKIVLTKDFGNTPKHTVVDAIKNPTSDTMLFYDSAGVNWYAGVQDYILYTGADYVTGTIQYTPPDKTYTLEELQQLRELFR